MFETCILDYKWLKSVAPYLSKFGAAANTSTENTF